MRFMWMVEPCREIVSAACNGRFKEYWNHCNPSPTNRRFEKLKMCRKHAIMLKKCRHRNNVGELFPRKLKLMGKTLNLISLQLFCCICSIFLYLELSTRFFSCVPASSYILLVLHLFLPTFSVSHQAFLCVSLFF